jgi:hypothetical protein
MHWECAPDVGDLHHIPASDFCRVRNRNVIHFTFDGQLVGQPPEDEPFTAAAVFRSLHQVGRNLGWREVWRRCEQALQEGVLRVYWAILGLFGFGARSYSGR